MQARHRSAAHVGVGLISLEVRVYFTCRSDTDYSHRPRVSALQVMRPAVAHCEQPHGMNCVAWNLLLGPLMGRLCGALCRR